MDCPRARVAFHVVLACQSTYGYQLGLCGRPLATWHARRTDALNFSELIVINLDYASITVLPA